MKQGTQRHLKTLRFRNYLEILRINTVSRIPRLSFESCTDWVVFLVIIFSIAPQFTCDHFVNSSKASFHVLDPIVQRCINVERRILFLQEVLTENLDGDCFFVVLGKVAFGLAIITLWFYCNLVYYRIPFLPVSHPYLFMHA